MNRDETMEVVKFDAGKAYPTSLIAENLLAISENLTENNAKWLKKAAERMNLLQSLCRPKRVVKKGSTYSCCVRVDKDCDQSFFDVMMSFDQALEFAKRKFEQKKPYVRAVEITRDDKAVEYEPYGKDDI